MTDPVGGTDSATGGEGTPVVAPAARPKKEKRPLYPRLLHLQHVHPNAWQRAALGEGAIGVAALLCLADVASLWTLVVLPVGVAAVVKAHDQLAGLLERPAPCPRCVRTAARGRGRGSSGRADDDGAGPRGGRRRRHRLREVSSRRGSRPSC